MFDVSELVFSLWVLMLRTIVVGFECSETLTGEDRSLYRRKAACCLIPLWSAPSPMSILEDMRHP
jgi:hypothetical protein